MMEGNQWKCIVPYIGIPLFVSMFLLLRWRDTEALMILQNEILIIIGYICAVRDIKERKVSNQTILAMFVCWMLTLMPQLAISIEQALARMASSAGGFLIGGALFLLVYFLSRNGLGGGDVKFMAVTGLYLGINGILPAMLYGSVLASIFGITLILLKKMGRKDTIPLIPFLYVGIVLTIFFF